MPKLTMHADTPFAKWLFNWIDMHGYTAERLANEMGNTGAMISKWINGQSIPDAKNLLKLAEVTGESHWYLAEVAWDWPGVPQSDDLLKDAESRQMAKTFEGIRSKSPELADDLLEVGLTMLRRAKKRKRDDDQNGKDT